MNNFVQVVETGSFSAASKVLNKNASSVARQINKLEEELCTRLFYRSTRRLELTLTGQGFYQKSIAILNAVTEAKQSVSDENPEIKGSASITVDDSFGRQLIVPLLPKFCQKYPHTNIALSLDNNLVDLYQSQFDIAIRYGKTVDSNLIIKPLLKGVTALVASPKYLCENPKIRHPEDLKSHNCLTFQKQRQYTFWYFNKGNEQQKVKVDGSLSACGGDPLALWAKEGIGLTLLSRWIIEKELGSGQLVEVLPNWTPSFNEVESQGLYMMWAPTSAQKPAVRRLIDFIGDEITAGKLTQKQSLVKII